MKIYYKLLSIIFLFAFCNIVYIKNIFATDFNTIGSTNVSNFDSCGKWNGCISHIGYRFYIVKDVQIKSTGISYNLVTNNYYDYSKDYQYNLNGLFTDIKSGGNLFQNILANTKVSMSDFFQKQYYILVESYFQIYYWNDESSNYVINSNTNIFTGNAKKVANKIYNTLFEGQINSAGYNKYGGFRSVTQIIPCTVYVADPNGGDDYCKEEDNSYHVEKYLVDYAIKNNRYGHALVSASAITQLNGQLKITKTNSEGKTISGSSATFNIYNNSNCSGSAIKSLSFAGTTTLDLAAGTYSIKETVAPKSYNLDNTCHSINIKENETTSISIKNTQTCESEFNALSNKKDRASRITLYQKYSKRNLLDFDNVTDPCGNPMNCNDNINVGCLSSDFTNNSNFSADNMSCYDETIKVGTLTGYCGIAFNLGNNLGSSSFSYTSAYSFGTTLAGQMIIKRIDPVIAQASLVKTCYVYGNNNSSISAEFNTEYDSYIGDLSFAGIVLSPTITNSGWATSNNASYTTLTKTLTANYYLNPIYANNGLGNIRYDSCNDNTCKFLGYGFTANLNDEVGTHNIPFSLNIKSTLNAHIIDSISNACTYNIEENPIIDKLTPNEENLNLEFRLIDTSNPFPGKNGVGRTPGSNWNIESYVEKYITEANNSYNKNKVISPKYTIILDSSTIQKIRKYNNKNPYNDYNMECDEEGNNCESNFLKDNTIWNSNNLR